jgi:hypothetical protein
MNRGRFLACLVVCALIGLVLFLSARKPAALEATDQASGEQVTPAPAVAAARNPAPLAPSESPGLKGAEPASSRLLISRMQTLSMEERRLLWEAEEAAVASCMEGRGFTYVPSKYDRTRAKETDPANIERGDVDAARTMGYGLADAMQRDDRPEPAEVAFDERLKNLPPEQRAAYMLALGGVDLSRVRADDAGQVAGGDIATVVSPDGSTVKWDRNSCFARGRREVYGDELSYRKLTLELMVLRRKLMQNVEQDEAWKQGLAQWRACMHGRGFPYDEPVHARTAMRDAYRDVQAGKGDFERARARELAVATADAECWNTADLERIGAKAEARADAALSAAHQPLLLAVQAGQVAALERSEAMVEN